MIHTYVTRSGCWHSTMNPLRLFLLMRPNRYVLLLSMREVSQRVVNALCDILRVSIQRGKRNQCMLGRALLVVYISCLITGAIIFRRRLGVSESSLRCALLRLRSLSRQIDLLNSSYSTTRFAFTYAWWSAFGYDRHIQSNNAEADAMEMINQEKVTHHKI